MVTQMIIAISGTPGVGKTIISRLLAKKMGAKLISIKNIIENHKIKYVPDRKRKTKIVDVNDIQKEVRKELDKNKTNIIEGHLSHLLRADMVFVLRCNPFVLRKRLKKRRWNNRKIDDNVLSEMLDIIPMEALRRHKKIYQIDTTNKEPYKTADRILMIMKKPKSYKEKAYNWLEKQKQFIMLQEKNS